MVDHAYQFSRHEQGELALYNPFEASWDTLPDRCVIMTHWHRAVSLEAHFRQHGFLVVTLARHPLDVLLSILQYAPCEGSLRWLEGSEGDERPIFHVPPLSEAFERYATGPRARALLAVSQQWWNALPCHRIRYEELIGDPRRELKRIERALGATPEVSFEDSIDACTFDRLKNPVTARHFWQGKAGVWRRLLPGPLARRIASAHREVFATLGYRCDPDESLDEATAAQNWTALTSKSAASAA